MAIEHVGTSPCESAVLVPVLRFRITWGEVGRLVDDQFNMVVSSSPSTPRSPSIPAPLARIYVFFLIACVPTAAHLGRYRYGPRRYLVDGLGGQLKGERQLSINSREGDDPSVE